ncbi:hypothetical protein EGR_11087 [Echinococcus granulosus]|uniref:Uncharacterized protein n=1 Tax=Echinococcus granulosus TaxID=6210 RepID=W6TZA1_ECHGR|nr:hypothetical protein EGR_11087 [Echinococcus granulosus]EUB54053.1 hypothetical protein EGR_11087 [Echinococcus granulosus]
MDTGEARPIWPPRGCDPPPLLEEENHPVEVMKLQDAETVASVFFNRDQDPNFEKRLCTELCKTSARQGAVNKDPLPDDGGLSVGRILLA